MARRFTATPGQTGTTGGATLRWNAGWLDEWWLAGVRCLLPYAREPLWLDRKGVDCFERGGGGQIIVLLDGGRFPIVLHEILSDLDKSTASMISKS